MKIELHPITIRKLVEGYLDAGEDGVSAFGGSLDVRPAYQREFVYKDKQRNAVIDSIKKKYPLNVMYWAVMEPGKYEIMDGQQRTISICQYCTGIFNMEFQEGVPQSFNGLTFSEREEILNYELLIYFCEGTDKEKLDWFKIINIAGERLTDQEMLNTTYTGAWLYDAKKRFSKTGCDAYGIAEQYMTGSCIRQEYLETALDWISRGNIGGYMSKHQSDPNANELWLYFESVINWINVIFPKYRREMKGIAWGHIYNQFKDTQFDTANLEKEITRLMMDDDVTNKKGIYEYVLSGDEKHLNIRAFTQSMKREAYEKQDGMCPECNEHFEIQEMEGDHITPWSEGGKTQADNLQMLCKNCNRRKGKK